MRACVCVCVCLCVCVSERQPTVAAKSLSEHVASHAIDDDVASKLNGGFSVKLLFNFTPPLTSRRQSA